MSIALSTLLISGCTSNTLKFAKNLKNTPELTTSNMTDAIACMGSSLKKNHSSNAYLFLVRDVNDGTVKDSVYQDSPLSDAGRIQLQNVLSEHLYPQAGLVMDNFPLIFSQLGKEGLGLNRFGLPSSDNLKVFMASYEGIIQGSRRAKGLPAAGSIIPLVVTGSFTRYDSDNVIQSGSGKNAGSRTKTLADNETDDNWRRISGQVDVGNTSSARAISLVMNLVDPRNNIIVSSQSFDLIFYRNNKTFRLRIAAGDGYSGISRSRVEVEGLHSAQKTLLDAAAFWLLNKAYGSQTNFSSCFQSDAQKNLTLTHAKIGQIKKDNLAAQAALTRKETTKVKPAKK